VGSSSDADARTETVPLPAPASAHLTPSSPLHSQTKTENPLSRESGRDWHQERRPYHPKPPAHRSEWVLWAGNVPSDATTDELRDFFNQPLPPPSPSQSGSSIKAQGVYGGVSSVFLIARSNCAFINFESKAQLEAATTRFDGEPIRPNEPRCPRLVCRIRKGIDDLKAGVGAQRGSAMHLNWVREQRAKGKSERIDSLGLSEGTGRSSSPLPSSSDDDQGRSTSSCSTCCVSVASTDSGILSRYFPQRYFILKSLTQVIFVACVGLIPKADDLIRMISISAFRRVSGPRSHTTKKFWIKHIAPARMCFLSSASTRVANSTDMRGQFFSSSCILVLRRRRMAGPIQQGEGEDRVPWASRPTSPTSTPLSQVSKVEANVPLSFPDESVVEPHQEPRYLLSPEEHRVVDQSPESNPCPPGGSSPPEGSSSARVVVSSELHGPHASATRSAHDTGAGPPRASIPFESLSFELHADAPYRVMKESPDQIIHQGAHTTVPTPPGEEGVSEHGQDAALQTVAEEPARHGDAPHDAPVMWGRPFRVDWVRTTHLPFFCTRNLRNPWNQGREVKVSRDGTELEPTVGRQFLEMWDKPPPPPADVPAASSHGTHQRRGPKSTRHIP